MSNECVDMWSYYRDKYGVSTALENYFEGLCRQNIDLQVALAQIKNAERAINTIMEEIDL